MNRERRPRHVDEIRPRIGRDRRLRDRCPTSRRFRYPTAGDAYDAALWLSTRTGLAITVEACSSCSCWHLVRPRSLS